MRHLFASNTLPSVLPLLPLIILLLHTPTTIRAQDDATRASLYRCSDSTNYTSGSQFDSNLKNLIPSLVSNGSLNGFFNTTSGTDPDTIYGLVQCRADISMEECQFCLNMSAVWILRNCSNTKDATVRWGTCMLRYSDKRFFSILDFDDLKNWWYWYWNNDNPIKDLLVFNQQLRVLLNNLMSMAISKPSKFMTGSIRYDNFSEIYGLVDCTPDLSSSDCTSCLQAMVARLPNCCPGKKGARVLSRSCEIWYRDFPFYVELLSPPPTPLTPPAPTPPALPAPPAPDSSSPNYAGRTEGPPTFRKVVLIVGSSLGVVAILLLLVLCAYFVRRKRMQKDKYSGLMDVDNDIKSTESLQFEFSTIRIATGNFADTNKLGGGGFGEVYKGELPDKQEIAVKRLSKNSGQGSQEFKNEVVLLHKLQHRNLVRLLGFCLEGEEKLLIYEYVPNRSLDKNLFAPKKRIFLNWEKRYKIIGGIARGLLYLHEDSRLRIIHRDLKAGNILLDDDMDAKIADFGMAKLFGVNQTQGNTSRIGGTFGYIAPEYALHGLFSVKSDVFSFGVLVLEIISGQTIINFHQSFPQENLLSYAWKLWLEGTPLQLMDPTLFESFSRIEVMKSIHIGLLCVQENIEDRPTMSSVVSMLNSNSMTMASPLQPAFFRESSKASFKGEQESDLYKQNEQEAEQLSSGTSNSNYASRMVFPNQYPR